MNVIVFGKIISRNPLYDDKTEVHSRKVLGMPRTLKDFVDFSRGNEVVRLRETERGGGRRGGGERENEREGQRSRFDRFENSQP